MKTIKLRFNKVLDGCSYEQVAKMKDSDNFYSELSNSQIMKRLSHDEANEIINELKKQRIEII